MAEVEIIYEGDPRLRQKCVKIRKVDNELRKLAVEMRKAMNDVDGVGLAAPQVGLLRRFVVIHKPARLADEEEPELNLDLVNPEIIRSSGRQVGPEGCLSIPNWVGDVPRAMHVTVKAHDLNDKEIRIKASGALARILQHEIDHLDGILFVDRVEDKSTLQYVPDETEDEVLAE